MTRPVRRLSAALFLLSVLAAAVAATVLGDRFSARIDTSTAGQHRLSSRVGALLDNDAARGSELVFVYDASARDPRLLDRVRDVLEAAAAAGAGLTLTEIDTSSARGFERARGVLDRVRERQRPVLDAADDAIRATAEVYTAVASDLRTLSDPLRAAAGDRRTAQAARLEQQAAVVRSLARQVADLADQTESHRTAGTLDPAEIAQALLAARAPLEEQLLGLAESLEGSRDDRLNGVARAARLLRDRVAATADRLARTEMPSTGAVAAALDRREALILLPPRTARSTELAVAPIDELFPAVVEADTAGRAAHAEAARRTEELLAALLVRTTRSDRPIVVLMHGQWQSLVDTPGLLDGLRQRLGRAGIDLVDWPAARDESAPPIAAIDPAGTRPVVHAVLPPDSWVGATALPTGETIPNGTQRARRLADAVRGVLDDGGSLLVCLNPTVFTTYGSDDPLVEALSPAGIGIASGHPILRSVVRRGAGSVTERTTVVPAETTHPVAASVTGLPIAFDWMVGLATNRPAAAVLTVPSDANAWAERDWLPFIRVPAAQRPIAPDPPSFDGATDSRGPWVAAAAAEFPPGESVDAPQRVFVVGASGWFLDRVWLARQGVDGRSVLASPGNIELFEAAVSWLAGQDELIGPSPSASPAPLVRPIEADRLALLRWGLVAGLPLAVLLTGAAYHLRRRLV